MCDGYEANMCSFELSERSVSRADHGAHGGEGRREGESRIYLLLSGYLSYSAQTSASLNASEVFSPWLDRETARKEKGRGRYAVF